jgi:hypothetical protein
MIVSSGHATLWELQSVYGVRDAYDLVELIGVDSHNQREVQKRKQS